MEYYYTSSASPTGVKIETPVRGRYLQVTDADNQTVGTTTDLNAATTFYLVPATFERVPHEVIPFFLVLSTTTTRYLIWDITNAHHNRTRWHNPMVTGNKPADPHDAVWFVAMKNQAEYLDLLSPRETLKTNISYQLRVLSKHYEEKVAFKHLMSVDYDTSNNQLVVTDDNNTVRWCKFLKQ